uniref:Mercuric reductase n=1 Tax=Roseihalotalea indica TaxID=2867963 RepID=A0AA49GR43_9BACT|nr:mercuric reductase [Tunicatimonas sp. TK19036]
MPQYEQYDAIIIGAGQSGSPMAGYLAKKGIHTALIEESHVGGTCVNTGCTPTKTLIASAKSAYEARRSADYGVHLNDVSVNIKEAMSRKDKIVESSRNGQYESLSNTENLDLIEGKARFTDKKTITVSLNSGGERTLQADQIFIDTGARSLIPPIDGLDQVKHYDNRTIMELDTLPPHLLVIGGGYIGLEFGQMFHRFGSKVTIFHSDERILDIEDEDVSEEMENILQEEGIDIITNCKIKQIKREGDEIILSGEGGGLSEDIRCSHVLLAVGRKPNTGDLGLDKAGIKTDDKGYIQVNDQLETSVEGVYALGDVKGGPQFTHVSYNDYVIVKKNLFEEGNESTSDRILTYTVFTDPQLGRVGLNEQQAKDQNIDYAVVKLPMEKVARAYETGHTRGFMKALVDKETGAILGASILGMEGGEVASALLFAMMGGLTAQQLRDTAIAHPTLMESLNNLFAQL